MAPSFPASYSTLDTQALASLVSKSYGLDVTNCRFLTRGVGDTYLIESATDRYILRIYRNTHRTLPQIEAEIALLLALQQAAIPVSYPIKDVSGNAIQSIQAIEGTRHAALFSWAQGEAARTLTEKQLQTLGQQMARFHNVSSTIAPNEDRWKVDFDSTLRKPLQLLKPHFKDNPEDFEWLEQSANSVITHFNHLDTSKFSTGYCHFDFLPKNFHFEGDSITFFDFDFMGYGWLAYDLAGFWQHLQLDVYAGRMTKGAADTAFDTLIRAYRRERSLSDNELASMPWLTLGFWLFYMSFHTTHDQFYGFAQPTHRNAYLGFLRQLVATCWHNA
jgi:Ser/Thr protein kinase RdoA (MazF antagonist)